MMIARVIKLRSRNKRIIHRRKKHINLLMLNIISLTITITLTIILILMVILVIIMVV